MSIHQKTRLLQYFSQYLFLFFVTLLACKAQAITPTNILNTSQVNAVLQDKNGYIWFAGQHGLSRFDGSEVITFSQNSKLWHVDFSWVLNLSRYGDKFLVATENNGSWIFDPITFTSNKIDANIDPHSHYDTIYFNGAFYIFVLTDKRLYRIQPTDFSTQIVADNVEIDSLVTTEKYLYFLENNKLYQISQGQSKAIPLPYVGRILGYKDNLIATTEQQIIRINDNGQKFTAPLNAKVTAMNISNDSSSILATNQSGNLVQFDATTLTEIPTHYPSLEINKWGLITQLYQDYSGLIWLTSSQGIFQLKPERYQDHQVMFKVAINAQSLTTFNEKLILGNYGGGLAQFAPDSPITFQKMTALNQQLDKLSKTITGFAEINQTLYVATFGGVYQLSTDLTLKKANFPNNNDVVLRLIADGHKLLIATDGNGLKVFNTNTGIMEQTYQQTAYQDTLSSNEIIDVFVAKDGHYWLATAEGVDIIDTKSSNVNNIDLPGNTKAISIIEADNKIFVATKGDGLHVFDYNGQILSRFNQGINFSYLTLINNTIWAPASPGLYLINPKTYQTELLADTEEYSFTDKAIQFEQSIFVPHFGGVLQIPTIQENYYNPPVHISKIIVSGKKQLVNKTIQLTSPNDVISFSLASMDYRPGKLKTFQYRINQNPWNTLQGNQLTLTGLASGNYAIEIKGTNSLGRWSPHHAFANISVAYPWYWTPQIRILYVIILLASIIFAVWLLYLRSKSIHYIHHLLRNDLKTRGNVALNVSHKLSLAQQALKQQQTEQATQLIEHSIKELEQANSSTEPCTLMGSTLASALPYLSNYISKKHHIDVSNRIEIDDMLLSKELQADLYRLIYEAITSAIRTGQSRQFQVNLKEFKNKIWLTIQDDSNTFASYTNKIHFNIAMYFIRQIAKKYHASVNAYSEGDLGSQLIISIPMMSQFINSPED